jgi:bacillithiol biosynthesis deacetylase BshB1
METVDLLAVGAHPDDVEFGAGGLLALSVARGYRIGVADLTRGEAGSKGDAELRSSEARAAAEVYHAAFRLNLDLGDSRLADGPEPSAALAEIIRRSQPRIVLAPPASDRHPDHRAAALIVRRAVLYAGLPKLAGEASAHSARAVLHYAINEWDRPDLVVDVSSAWSEKLRAVRAYASQTERTAPVDQAFFGASDYMRLIEARAAFHGALIGVAHGEGFWVAHGGVPMPDPLRVFA